MSDAFRSDWHYLLDLDAEEHSTGSIGSYSPPDAKSSVGDFFRAPRYPYPKRLSVAEYVRENLLLQIELVKLQNWIQDTGGRLLILFEGRDTAGKGSAIRTVSQHLNPRFARVVALEIPTERERGQWYFQRYTAQLPGAGEIVLFDRSWYNRAGVERVMGFCSEQQYGRFVRQVPEFERMLVEDGVHLLKFYLSISKEEQARRLQERQRNPLKQWKLSPIDQEAQERWDAYTDAKEETMRRTDSAAAPWILLKADDKLRARLNLMRYVLTQLPYTGRNLEAIGPVDPLLVASAASVYAG